MGGSSSSWRNSSPALASSRSTSRQMPKKLASSSTPFFHGQTTKRAALKTSYWYTRVDYDLTRPQKVQHRLEILCVSIKKYCTVFICSPIVLRLWLIRIHVYSCQFSLENTVVNKDSSSFINVAFVVSNILPPILSLTHWLPSACLLRRFEDTSTLIVCLPIRVYRGSHGL